MSNLTKYEVLKHRHLSLLKKLEERGIEAKYSQLEGEWQITMPPAETNAIEVKVEGDTAKALENWLKRDAEKNVPAWVRGFDERQGIPKRAVDSGDVLRESMLAAGIRSMIGVKDDEGC